MDITISPKDGFNEIIVQDDTEDETKTNNLMIQTITISIAVVILLTGGILSFVQPHNYSLLWTVTVSFIVAALGFVNTYHYKDRVRFNTKQDVDFLVRLLNR